MKNFETFKALAKCAAAKDVSCFDAEVDENSFQHESTGWWIIELTGTIWGVTKKLRARGRLISSEVDDVFQAARCVIIG